MKILFLVPVVKITTVLSHIPFFLKVSVMFPIPSSKALTIPDMTRKDDSNRRNEQFWRFVAIILEYYCIINNYFIIKIPA